MLNNLLSSATWYPFLFDVENTADFAKTIAFWLTIIIAIGIICFAILSKRDSKAKIILTIAIGYSAVVAIFFLIMNFIEDGILPILFYPILSLIIVSAVFGVILCFKRNKALIITAITTAGLCLLATLICMGVYFSSGDAEENNWISITLGENIALYICTLVLIALLIVITYITSKNDKSSFDSKSIAYAALCIAMSFALSYVRIVKLPQGGSITVCSLLPLMIYSYMFGTKKGLFAGFIYGILQAVQDPWIVHPMQFLLDYPVAFASIGISGCFAKLGNLEDKMHIKFTFGAVIASVLRFTCHLFSGVFAFSEYAFSSTGEPMNAWLYSLMYNSFVFIDIAICVIVGIILFSSKSLKSQLKKI